MASIRLYIDLESLAGSDYKFAEIYECTSPDDEGTLIETVEIKAGADYITSASAVDPYSWFKIGILDGAEAPLFDADKAVLAEIAQEKIIYVRGEIKDTNLSNPAFSDDELVAKMRLAALRFNKIRNLADIPENVWPIIIILIRIDTCHVLAYDYAKYVRLEVPGGPALSKDQLYTHYLEVAKGLEEYYDKIISSLTKKGTENVNSEDGMAEINVSSMIYDRE
jgi:hypothetical protein